MGESTNERFVSKQIFIELKRVGGKLWVAVSLLPGKTEWMPSFEELYIIHSLVSICEELKYPSTAGYRGADEVCNFLDAISKSIRGSKGKLPSRLIMARWIALAHKFRLKVKTQIVAIQPPVV